MRKRTPPEEDGIAGDQRGRDETSGDRLLLTPEEAAQVLQLGRTTVYALMKAGDLRPIHIGRNCRLSRAELSGVRQLEAPGPTPSRSSPHRRTTTDQHGLFELGPPPPDAA